MSLMTFKDNSLSHQWFHSRDSKIPIQSINPFSWRSRKTFHWLIEPDTGDAIRKHRNLIMFCWADFPTSNCLAQLFRLPLWEVGKSWCNEAIFTVNAKMNSTFQFSSREVWSLKGDDVTTVHYRGSGIITLIYIFLVIYFGNINPT